MNDFPLKPNISDLYHVARKVHYDARTKGQETHHTLALMGACLVAMGSTMLYKAWNQSQGRSR